MFGILLRIVGLPGGDGEGERLLSVNGLGRLAWASCAGEALYLSWSVFSSRLPSPDSEPVSLQGFVKTLTKCSKLGDDGVDRADFDRVRGWLGIWYQ
jgi:hypothetical protein